MSITTAGDAIRYEEFRTADTAAMRRFFADAYPPSWRVGAVSDGAQSTHRRFATDSVTLNEVLIDGRLSCEIEAFDTVLAIHPLSGSMAVTAEPKRGLETVVIAADALPCAIDVEDARFRVVGLGMRELSRVASEGKSIPPQHVRFLDYKPRSAAAANSRPGRWTTSSPASATWIARVSRCWSGRPRTC